MTKEKAVELSVPFERPVNSRVAAPLVGVHYKTLEEMARAGEVPAAKFGKSWLFRISILSERIDSQLRMNSTRNAAG
ncbi:MAG: helix-turn-helix domain-containing protein [Terracidiphilus sp.]|jgi:excisionase family DNA binding protein